MATLNYNGVTASLEPGWEDGTQVTLLGPQSGGFRANVVITRERSSAGNAEQFGKQQIAGLRQNLQGFELVKEGAVTVGGRAGYMSHYRFKANGQSYAQIQQYAAAGGMMYTLTFSHLAAHFDSAKAAAERLMASVKLPG